MTIKELEPKALWSNFYSLTRCPRPSKHEEAVRNFLVKWAKDKKIECRVDKVGNVIMTKPATKGMENRRPVVLQAHMDMVPQARAGKVHDFLKDPIETKIVEDWVYACDTTLGADDGMGVAAIMAVFESKTIKHGPLEALITTDEETGMTGAFGLPFLAHAEDSCFRIHFQKVSNQGHRILLLDIEQDKIRIEYGSLSERIAD